MQKTIILFLTLLFTTSMAIADKTYTGKGKVNAVKIKAEKLTIKHGPIDGLMGAMTMDFNVIDPSMLSDVKKGNVINFSVKAGKNGNFIITDLEVVDLK